MRKLVAVVVCALALLACADPAPEQGYVRHKDFDPAHTDDGGGHYDCYSYSSGICTLSVWVEDPDVYVPDRWYLFLEDCPTTEGKTKCSSGWLRVDETDFHRYNIGQHYPEAVNALQPYHHGPIQHIGSIDG